MSFSPWTLHAVFCRLLPSLSTSLRWVSSNLRSRMCAGCRGRDARAPLFSNALDRCRWIARTDCTKQEIEALIIASTYVHTSKVREFHFFLSFDAVSLKSLSHIAFLQKYCGNGRNHLFHEELSQSLDFPTFDFVQFGADVMIHVLELVRYFARLFEKSSTRNSK